MAQPSCSHLHVSIHDQHHRLLVGSQSGVVFVLVFAQLLVLGKLHATSRDLTLRKLLVREK